MNKNGRPRNTVELILRKYVRPAQNGCWIWIGKVSKRGYGMVSINYQSWMAHRLFAHNAGMDVDGKLVCHHCDTPLCVNPDHLFVGSHQDNMRDRGSKNRQARQRGEDGPTARLSNKDVLGIRRLANRYTQSELAAMFCVSQPHINRILKRLRWSHI